MRQLLASIFTLLLTTAIALALDRQAKAEIDDVISYVETSGVRFIASGACEITWQSDVGAPSVRLAHASPRKHGCPHNGK